jgi:glutathionylspermidine synthase
MRREVLTPRADWQRRVEEVGLEFHTQDGVPYWAEDRCYAFTADEIDGLEAATNELHDLCLQAADQIVRHNRHSMLGIPEWAVGYVNAVWERRDPTFVGRFDLAYDGSGPPKMLEYNADTPTSLVEAAVAQWFWLNDVKPGADQFNSIHERLIEAWKALAPHVAQSGKVHFASQQDSDEDRITSDYLRDTCQQAGIATVPLDVSQIGWNGSRFTDLEERPIQAMFKLYPWEWMLADEFGRHAVTDTTGFIEPAWKMLLSNKAILPILWELFPDHPNLLPAYFTPERLAGKYVRKPFLSREGLNVAIVGGPSSVATPGPYDEKQSIYQAIAPLAHHDGHYAVLGSWVIAGESAGIGIREDTSAVTGNLSRFVPHYFTASGN